MANLYCVIYKIKPLAILPIKKLWLSLLNGKHL